MGRRKVKPEQQEQILGVYSHEGAKAAGELSVKLGLCYLYAPNTAKRLGVSRPKRFWTDAEDAIATELLAADAPEELFLEKIGWSKYRAMQRMDRIRTGRVTRMRGVTPTEGRVDVPEHVWADAMRRANAPRSLTEILCGDPGPTRSALYQKQMEGA